MQRVWLWCKVCGLLASWLGAIALMDVSFRLNPPILSRSPLRMGFAVNQNLPDELERTLFLSIVELVVLGLLLRPWSSEPLAPRLAVTIGLLLFWMVLFGVATTQAGMISKINLLWLLGVWLCLLLELAGLLLWGWLRSWWGRSQG